MRTDLTDERIRQIAVDACLKSASEVRDITEDEIAKVSDSNCKWGEHVIQPTIAVLRAYRDYPSHMMRTIEIALSMVDSECKDAV